MADNVIISIFGRKGSGKTTLARRIIREYPRVIVIDTVGQYPEMEVVFGRESILDRLLRANKERAFRLSLRSGQTEDLLDALEVCYEIPHVMLVIEEAGFYCSPTLIPDAVSKLVRYGRHRAISQIYIAQRPSALHRDMTSQSDLIVSFVQTEPRDVDYLRATVGPEAEDVRTLKGHDFRAWGDLSKAPLPILERELRAARSPRLKKGLDNVIEES